ncbi:hypothetical protein T484DRAFT_2629202, partial [Baffinella frigidus]
LQLDQSPRLSLRSLFQSVRLLLSLLQGRPEGRHLPRSLLLLLFHLLRLLLPSSLLFLLILLPRSRRRRLRFRSRFLSLSLFFRLFSLSLGLRLHLLRRCLCLCLFSLSLRLRLSLPLSLSFRIRLRVFPPVGSRRRGGQPLWRCQRRQAPYVVLGLFWGSGLRVQEAGSVAGALAAASFAVLTTPVPLVM